MSDTKPDPMKPRREADTDEWWAVPVDPERPAVPARVLEALPKKPLTDTHPAC